MTGGKQKKFERENLKRTAHPERLRLAKQRKANASSHSQAREWSPASKHLAHFICRLGER
jgi:hypothetical protein